MAIFFFYASSLVDYPVHVGFGIAMIVEITVILFALAVWLKHIYEFMNICNDDVFDRKFDGTNNRNEQKQTFRTPHNSLRIKTTAGMTSNDFVIHILCNINLKCCSY